MRQLGPGVRPLVAQREQVSQDTEVRAPTVLPWTPRVPTQPVSGSQKLDDL